MHRKIFVQMNCKCSICFRVKSEWTYDPVGKEWEGTLRFPVENDKLIKTMKEVVNKRDREKTL